MADAAPEIRIREVLLPGDLLTRHHVPEAELSLPDGSRETRPVTSAWAPAVRQDAKRGAASKDGRSGNCALSRGAK